MNIKKTIITLVIILIVAAGLYFLWQNRHKYFFQGELENIEEEESANKPKDVKNTEDPEYDDAEVGEDEDDEEGNEEEAELNGDTVSEEIIKESYQEILETDCQNKCEDKKDTDDYQYCLEICGLRRADQGLSDDCSTLSGLDKDTCYKNKAIKEKDYKYCKEIEDDNLRESCKDRVLEEILEE